MSTRVVNEKRHRGHAIYIGRKSSGMHYGNPFSHLPDTLASVRVESRDEAIDMFEKWLKGETHADLEPERREWILSMLPYIKGETLACHCAPKRCHGDVLAKMAEESR